MDAAFDAHGQQRQQQPTTIGGGESGDAFASQHLGKRQLDAWPTEDSRSYDAVEADRSYLPHLMTSGYAAFAAPSFGHEAHAPSTFGQQDGSPRLMYLHPSAAAESSTWQQDQPFEAAWPPFHPSAANGGSSAASLSEEDESDEDDDERSMRAHSPSGPFISTVAGGPQGQQYRPNAAIAPPGGETVPCVSSGERSEAVLPAPLNAGAPAALVRPTVREEGVPVRAPPANRQVSTSGHKPTLKLSRADKVAIIHEHDAKPSLTQQETATKWSVDRSTISKILHSRERWLAPASPPRAPTIRPAPRKVTLRPEGGRYKPVEERINGWLDQRYKAGAVVDDVALRQEAREVWRMIQRENGEIIDEIDESKSFKASAKWLGSFKDRRRLSGRLMAPLPPPDQPPPLLDSTSTSRPHSATCSPAGPPASPHGQLQSRASQSSAAPSQQLLQQQPMQPRRQLAHRLSALSIPAVPGAGPAHALPFSPPDSATSVGFAGSQGIASGVQYSNEPTSPRRRSFSASTEQLINETDADTGAHSGNTSGLLSPFSADWTSSAPGRFAQQQQQPPRRPGSISRHTNPVYPPGEPTPMSGGGLGSRPGLAQRPHSMSSYPHYHPSPAQSESSQGRRRLGSGFEAKTQRSESTIARRDSSLASPATAEARSRTSSRTGSWAPSSPSASLFDRLEEERRRNSSVTSYGSSLVPPAQLQHPSQLTPGSKAESEDQWVVNAPTPPAVSVRDYFPQYAQPASGSAQYSQPPSPKQQSLELPQQQQPSFTTFDETSRGAGTRWVSQPSPLESAYESTSPGPVFGDAWSRQVSQPAAKHQLSIDPSGYGPAESDWHSHHLGDQQHGYHPEQAMSVDPLEFSRDLQELRLGGTPAPPPAPTHYASAPPPRSQGWGGHAAQWEDNQRYIGRQSAPALYPPQHQRQQQHGAHERVHNPPPQHHPYHHHHHQPESSISYPHSPEHGLHFADSQREHERVGHPHAEYAPYYTSHPASYPPQASAYGHHSSAKEPASYDTRLHGDHGEPSQLHPGYEAPPLLQQRHYRPETGHGHVDHPDSFHRD